MIPFLDLHKINARFKNQFHASLDNDISNAQYILGNNVSSFEKEFSDYCGTSYCIGTGNGLDALTLILKGYIEIGRLKIGDKVIVPANTFIATVLSVIHAGLEPIFVEPDPKTYNITADTISPYLTDDIKAIIVVHLYGQLADVSAIKTLIKSKAIFLIEDAAQAHGAYNEDGKAGNLGDASAFSFYPSKNLGALGDGGAITTNDKELNDMVRKLSNYGCTAKYQNALKGYNTRLDGIQASFLSIKLKVLDNDNQRRREIAMRYLKEIANPKLKLPYYSGAKNHVFYAFIVEVKNREAFTQYLNNNKIGWLIHYPIPPHKQEALKEYSTLSLPITERIHQNVISLPISPVMTKEEVNAIIQVLNAY
ncbi:DegT/DnrJ/EryC1/StrS family aminotransferase [Winogradskyella alexanderae]|uniref:DegT/DnrJ/EryC1/StrS family aminotransferase n=1 Tax=Winogradskyella alexanderae TaxID=2877123 RepID=A0ABS7XS55_9FLAO|nr:DegT/DnrJ/EryC1/StrS family aminotransferase [Winogradskyella alexanderae]MCA0132860.1 DegT/DnrJ/EryC1/StrS family aminotransferase [Winogradskyella alexanderae]